MRRNPTGLPKRSLPSARRMNPPGSSPGLLITNPEMHYPTKGWVTGYGPKGYAEQEFTTAAQLEPFLKEWPVAWIDIDGLANVALLEEVGRRFNLDRLLLEDVLDVHHRSKSEDYDDYLFMIIKLGIMDAQFSTEQVSLVLMDNVLITFQEKPGDSFRIVHERIRKSANNKIRQMGSDYLLYAILDTVVEGYYPILDGIHKQLESLEHATIMATSDSTIHRIHHIKNDLLLLHHSIWPVRDIIGNLIRGDCELIREETQHYYRDCQDHSIQITELAEYYRNIASDLMNTYVAYSSHKMNEIMKVLTMVSTIFIPLSFIVGVYGMNFDTSLPYNMPELRQPFGYLGVLGFMTALVIGMLFMFRRKGWIGGNGNGGANP